MCKRSNALSRPVLMGRGLDGYSLLFSAANCAVLRVRESAAHPVSGGYGEGETPLPIPNRAVKPLSADGTWPARAWESRSPPVFTPTPSVIQPGSASLRAAVPWLGRPGSVVDRSAFVWFAGVREGAANARFPGFR